MKLAIMQPYFFPYLTYFSLIKYVDTFILFDTVQYRRRSWMGRNRILKPQEAGAWQYVNAGVIKPPFQCRISEVLVNQDPEWKYKILRQLEHYKKTAPFYAQTTAFLEELLAPDLATLVELNAYTLKGVCEYIGIQHDIRVHSEMDLPIGTVEHAGQWSLRISEAMGMRQYVNPPGGKNLYVQEEFEKAGIELCYLQNRLRSYPQGWESFEPALSIIDVLMFNSNEVVKTMLDDILLSVATCQKL